MPSTERINYLFQRFFDKTYTPEEREELIAYIRQSKSDRQLKELIEESWNKDIPEYEQDPRKVDEIFRYIIQQGGKVPVTKKPAIRRVLLYAGSIAATMVLAWSAWYFWPRPEKTIQTGKAASHIVYQCKAGERATFVLPDGSIVKLNSNSSLTMPDNFSKAQRAVTLKGEAFFDVKPDKQKPFIITTNRMLVRVLGTSFNVKAYEEDDVFETAVIRGSVEVTLARNSQKVVLHPNEKISLTNTAATIDQQESQPARTNGGTEKIATVQPVTRNRDSSIVEISWTEDKLAFAGEFFPEIAKKIERWYNVKVLYEHAEAEQKLLYEQFTATFDNQPLELVMEALQLANGKFQYQVNSDGNVVIKN